jgi:hypothetical protein
MAYRREWTADFEAPLNPNAWQVARSQRFRPVYERRYRTRRNPQAPQTPAPVVRLSSCPIGRRSYEAIYAPSLRESVLHRESSHHQKVRPRIFFQSSPKASLEYEIAALLLAALKESRHSKRRPRNRQSSHNASLEYAEMRMAGCTYFTFQVKRLIVCTSATFWTTKSNFFTYISPSL